MYVKKKKIIAALYYKIFMIERVKQVDYLTFEYKHVDTGPIQKSERSV